MDLHNETRKAIRERLSNLDAQVYTNDLDTEWVEVKTLEKTSSGVVVKATTHDGASGVYNVVIQVDQL